tara:strand:- start:2690 stop:2884 length:195 start_codon:yes stop_codon:yes gene_type:complete
MSLKKIVNDKELWDALIEYYDEYISDLHRSMENLTEPSDLYRVQGSLSAIRKLKYMRDKVNGPR